MDDAFLLFKHALLLLKITNYEFLVFETTVFILYHFSGENCEYRLFVCKGIDFILPDNIKDC